MGLSGVPVRYKLLFGFCAFMLFALGMSLLQDMASLTFNEALVRLAFATPFAYGAGWVLSKGDRPLYVPYGATPVPIAPVQRSPPPATPDTSVAVTSPAAVVVAPGPPRSQASQATVGFGPAAALRVDAPTDSCINCKNRNVCYGTPEELNAQWDFLCPGYERDKAFEVHRRDVGAKP